MPKNRQHAQKLRVRGQSDHPTEQIKKEEASMKKFLHFLAIAFMLLFLSGQAFAQSGSTGAIEGKVLDEEEKPLPGVEVKLSSPDLIGGTQAKVTTAEGKFRFVALPRGTYVVESSLP
jgi:hypothetical protein